MTSDGQHCEQANLLGRVLSISEENSRQLESLSAEMRVWRQNYGERLGLVEKDAYAAKAVVRALLGVFAALATLVGWTVGKFW